MKAYDFIEHTADIGVKAYGETLDEAFSHVAQAMFDIITDHSKVDMVGEFKIELCADNLEQLLVDWLSDLLFLNTANNLVFGGFNVEITDNRLIAYVYGEEFDVSKHNIGMEIKAVTYHMLEVNTKKPIYVQVLFDI
ncbi:MAG: archease [Thermoplasmatota archaeon]